jgi:hypothetical protein
LQILQIAAPHGALDLARRRLATHLVAADGLKTDRLQNMDDIDNPADRRLPMDRFEYAADRRGRRNIVTDPLDLISGRVNRA